MNISLESASKNLMIEQNVIWNSTTFKVLQVSGFILSTALFASLPFAAPIWRAGITVGLAITGVLLAIGTFSFHLKSTAPSLNSILQLIKEADDLQQENAPPISASHSSIASNDCFYRAFKELIANDSAQLQALWLLSQGESLVIRRFILDYSSDRLDEDKIDQFKDAFCTLFPELKDLRDPFSVLENFLEDSRIKQILTLSTIQQITTPALQEKLAPLTASKPLVGISNSKDDCFFIAAFQAVIAPDQRLVQAIWNAAELKPDELQLKDLIFDLALDIKKLQNSKLFLQTNTTLIQQLSTGRRLEAFYNSPKSISQFLIDLEDLFPDPKHRVNQFIQLNRAIAKIFVRQFIVDYYKAQSNPDRTPISSDKTRKFRRAFSILFNMPILENGQQDAAEVLGFLGDAIVQQHLEKVDQVSRTYYQINETPALFDENADAPQKTNFDYDGKQYYYRSHEDFFNGVCHVSLPQSTKPLSIQKLFSKELSAAESKNTINVVLKHKDNEKIFPRWKDWKRRMKEFDHAFNKMSQPERNKRKPEREKLLQEDPSHHISVEAARVSNQFTSPPRQLLIQLKRFNSSNQKITTPIQAESELILPASATMASSSDTTYELQRFIVQTGGTSAGHYQAYVKRGDVYDHLDCLSKGTIESISRDQFFEAAKNAYELVYVKKEKSALEKSLEKVSLLKPWSILNFSYECFSACHNTSMFDRIAVASAIAIIKVVGKALT